MDCSMWGFPVHHQLPELGQIHVYRVGDAIQPSHPLLSPSLPVFYLPQNQGLFKWVSSLHQVAKVLELQLQHQSFQWMFRTDFLYNRLIGSPCSPRDSQESSPTPFKSINSSALSLLYGPTLTSIHNYWASQVVLVVKNPPANARDIRDVGLIPHLEMQVQSLGQEDPLEEGTATHSTILALRISWTEESGRLQSIGLDRVWRDLVLTHTSDSEDNL